MHYSLSQHHRGKSQQDRQCRHYYYRACKDRSVTLAFVLRSCRELLCPSLLSYLWPLALSTSSPQVSPAAPVPHVRLACSPEYKHVVGRTSLKGINSKDVHSPLYADRQKAPSFRSLALVKTKLFGTIEKINS